MIERESQVFSNKDNLKENETQYKMCGIDIIEEINNEVLEGIEMPNINDYMLEMDKLMLNACTVENSKKLTLSEQFDSVAGNLTMINENKRNIFMKMLKQFETLFSDKPGCVTNYVHKLKLKTPNPKINQSYPVPYALRDEVEACLNKMLQAKIIEPAISPYCNPLRIVRKSDGTVRPCLDARNLNKHIEDDHESPPIITDVMQIFYKCKFFSKIDMTMGYWQILLDKESRPLTAFIFIGRMYQYVTVPFGIKTAGSIFIRAFTIALISEVRIIDIFQTNPEF